MDHLSTTGLINGGAHYRCSMMPGTFATRWKTKAQNPNKAVPPGSLKEKGS